ncbi:MAG: thioesterase [Pseudoalteromonas sp.]|uniref:thioesterase II family protein n=1 Tax=Pseudoalteromonas sp. TaxID=53249 RepID=UPI001D2EAB51|nr:thioesterase domain-containing protein [Pseudoalteromonas sp.]NRA80053.1 thioesterase [Pseudoalteromonas sp.]
MKNLWVVKPKPLISPKIRLLCFAYAGGGTSVYHSWKDKLPNYVELNIVQLPGRGTHFSQKPIDNMGNLVADLMPNIENILQGKYIIFGHSLGSRIAFEVVRQAMLIGLSPPLHFFASGSLSPGTVCTDKKLYDLPADEFIKELKEINGTPDEVLSNKQFMELLLPTIRADFKIAAQYRFNDSFLIPSPITVISGKNDSLSICKLQMWEKYFTKCKIIMCEGGHFFIDEYPDQVISIVKEVVALKALDLA